MSTRNEVAADRVSKTFDATPALLDATELSNPAKRYVTDTASRRPATYEVK